MTASPLLDQDRLLDVLETEGLLLAESAESAESADPDLPILACPGLTLGDTVRHVGSVYRQVAIWIRSGARPLAWPREPADGQSTQDYLRDGLRALLGELATHDPTAPCATWHPHDKRYGFWRRRMAHESTVHRVDVQGATGSADTVADEVAIDGVDEVLLLWFTHRLSTLGVSGTRHVSVAVRAGEHVWLARVTADGTSAERASVDDVESADAVVSAAEPAEMYLWLWGRRPVFGKAVDHRGDYDAIGQLWALLRLATR